MLQRAVNNHSPSGTIGAFARLRPKVMPSAISDDETTVRRSSMTDYSEEDIRELSEDGSYAEYESKRALEEVESERTLENKPESDEFLVVVSCKHVLEKIILNENDEFASIVNADNGSDIAVAIIKHDWMIERNETRPCVSMLPFVDSPNWEDMHKQLSQGETVRGSFYALSFNVLTDYL